MPNPSLTVQLSPQAEADFLDILDWSVRKFGDAAAARYDDLILAALSDIGDDPLRPGAKHRGGLPPGVFIYHLANSRDLVSGEPVKSPRHFVLYRLSGQRLDVLRILHDARDLARHLPDTPSE